MKQLSTFLVACLLSLGSGFAYAGDVNINTDNAVQLAAELKGIGLTKAEAIVAYREEHGDFSTADDLIQVKGIGQRTIDANRVFIKLNNEEK